jgi:hypothetical protein
MESSQWFSVSEITSLLSASTFYVHGANREAQVAVRGLIWSIDPLWYLGVYENCEVFGAFVQQGFPKTVLCDAEVKTYATWFAGKLMRN